VNLVETEHMKLLGKRVIEPQSILRACKEDKNIINAVCEGKRNLIEN
jgi:hypothetical protein